jgi:hypothetical protein
MPARKDRKRADEQNNQRMNLNGITKQRFQNEQERAEGNPQQGSPPEDAILVDAVKNEVERDD